MGKKRGKDKSFREDEDIDLGGPSCRHIKKGSDQSLLKKLAGKWDWSSCQDCQPEEENKENANPAVPRDADDEKEPAALWMCLKCGHRGCGRNSESQHAIKHYETPRSDPHCLVVSLDNWSVWCYLCDDEVQFSSTGHLAQLLTNLKKQTSSDSTKRPQKRVKEEDVVLEAPQKVDEPEAEEIEDKESKGNKGRQKKNTNKESAGKPQKPGAAEESFGIPVKGLSNLGNTCFFNAVIQNLSQTHLLRQILNKVLEEKTSLNIQPGASSNLEPVVADLEKPGPLTSAMCHLLNEIHESKRGVVTPQELFTQVCKKAARFKGFQQQDSQELLRYLLDGMRAEEIKRVSTAITESLKQSAKTTDGEQLKKLLKEYEKNGFPKNFVDEVFGGEITSTIMCQQCKTVSVVKEVFLDLSLPVSDEAYRKKSQKKGVQKQADSCQDSGDGPASANDDGGGFPVGSKYQQKKAKKQAKKQAKHQKRQQKLEGRVTLSSLTEGKQPDPTTDGDDGASADEASADGASADGASADGASADGASADGASADGEVQHEAPACEGDSAQSGVAQNPEAENQKEEDEEASDCDPSPAINRFTVLSEGDQQSKDEESASDAEQGGEADAQLASKMEKINLDEAFIDSDAMEESMEAEAEAEAEAEPAEDKEYIVVQQDPELAFQTLAPRSTPEPQECSVQSCLFQFTEVETLTQNNSLLCVTCTKRQTGKDKAEGSKKNVYTDALKQMLISSPPPVLTLHLKRFQQNGYSICKVNRHVQFPMILDLASFCGVKCENVAEGEQKKTLYSLYGIVQHSGTMRSGHYTAFVKVRPQCSKGAPNGLPAEGDAEPARGSWFHISDTSVQPVSESKVQGCQAYLLFYERVL